ncbi:unnamed protein product [Heterotrigona itama]|uniref:Ig-like domain-containing protein n=1 Tax=Heterotrigona itama TaxID=395501 RepID=A0A6V7HI59_9HYME|nr:unnamed protein product [Heterotrigona itama]
MEAGMCGGGAKGVNRGYVRNPCKDFMRAYKAGETRPSASSYILAGVKNFVSEPVTIIVGAPELFVNKGSTINLTCVVRYAPEPPPMMIWSHNTEFIRITMECLQEIPFGVTLLHQNEMNMEISCKIR